MERHLSFALALLMALMAGTANAQIIQSGFNDVSGINGDGVPNNSPFNTADAPLGGQGASEPGWAGPWHNNGGGIVSQTAFEGDGAAAFFQNTAGTVRALGRAPANPFSIDVRLMIPQAVTRDVLFRIWDGGIVDIFRAIGVQWQVESDLGFYVLDGTENSCTTGQCNLESTGMRLTPGVWHLVRVEIDPASRTWDFSVDGVRYAAPDPLGFRGQPTRLDRIEYLNEIAAPGGSYLDAVVINIVPEPLGLLWLGGLIGSRRICRARLR
jgi:hypothetical protein